MPPRRYPFIVENGAFRDWQNARAFNVEEYEHHLQEVFEHWTTPYFIVAPDIVAGGTSSLEVSRRWLWRLVRLGPVYLCVQDGMTVEDVRAAVTGFAGIFVGGSAAWKLETLPQWCALAASLGLGCHVGRMGSGPRVRWARACLATSVDSCAPLWSARALRSFLAALTAPLQVVIGGVAAPPTIPAARGKVRRKV